MLIAHNKKILWIFLLLISKISSEETLENKDTKEKIEEKKEEVESSAKDDLLQSESKDPGKIEIIKQIKRVNPDGSYTFGYEAEDGSFKIESRDVLGNVKGTFGYVDQDGEIKRVSYSSTNNGTDPSLLNDKDRVQVVQTVPKNLKPSPTTRRPTIIYPNITPSPSSTVIQTIPRRRMPKENTTTTTTTTERPAYKFEATSPRSQSTTEVNPRVLSPQQRTIYQNGHFIRSTLSPQVDVHRFTEGQLIRPSHQENVTPRPSDSYLRRLIITRNPLLDEQVTSTIKPIIEDNQQENVRGNLLRRQLSQEKVTDYNARQHIINLHQSTGHDANDVRSGSLTTGTPRPLFTTTTRPRNPPSQPTTPKGIISPAKYPVVFQKNAIRGPKFLEQYTPESSTDASNIPEPNYVTPTPLPQIPIIQIPQDDRVQLLQGRSLPNGAILIPVNQVPQRYMYDDPGAPGYPQYEPDPRDPYYQRVTPVPLVYTRRYPQEQDQYQKMELMDLRPYPVPINTNLQDDIDNIKPPVSTLDFQKLLNRLIIRQNHLREISRLEAMKVQDPYYGYRPQMGVPMQQGAPVSIFVRRDPNGPIQFVPRQQQRYFIPMQARMESQQYHSTEPYNPQFQEPYNPMYQHGRRVARLLDQNLRKEDENYLPPEVREMLLLKMLQLAINPNLPIPPTDQELMTTANPTRKEQVRNVQVLGEDDEEQKRSSRSKRYDEESDNNEEMDYYQ